MNVRSINTIHDQYKILIGLYVKECQIRLVELSFFLQIQRSYFGRIVHFLSHQTNSYASAKQ